MNNDIEEMINIYNTFEFDWMGDKINNLSSLTRHHIVKKENNGIDDKKNYALLTRYSHEFLHYMEIKYNKEYKRINEMFLTLNESNLPPTEEYFEEMKLILKRIKKDIKNKKRRKCHA